MWNLKLLHSILLLRGKKNQRKPVIKVNISLKSEVKQANTNFSLLDSSTLLLPCAILPQKLSTNSKGGEISTKNQG